MSKPSVRIVAPVLVALLCACVLLAFLWWQLSQSSELLRTARLSSAGDAPLVKRSASALPDSIDVRDRALMHLRQGDLLALRGNWFGAQREYEQAVREGGGLPALRKLAQAQLQRRDLDGVNATIRKLKAAGAKPEDLLLLESIVNLRIGELVQARTLLEGAEDSPQQHYGLALLAIIEGNHDIAQQELQAVINGWEPVLRSHAKTLQAAYDEFALFEESSGIHLTTLLSRSLAQVHECELALPLLSQVTQQKDSYRDAWIVQGYCELVTERTDQAVVSLEQAYSIDPQKSEIQYFLGRAYAAKQDHRNAITFLEYALANGFEPQSEIRRIIAEEALHEGNGQLALQQYTALLQQVDVTVDTYEGFVSTAIALGQTEEAYVRAVEAADRWPENGKAHELLGLAALATDRDDQARGAFERAVELDPFLLDARQQLENL